MKRLPRLVGIAFGVAGVLATTGVVLSQGNKPPADPPPPAGGGAPLPEKAALKPATHLPVSHVILFNSGVAHFTRAGEVQGDARVDLVFPEADINDLIKSMTISDPGGKGKGTAVTYDSRDPVKRTLKSFAVNLNGNPTFGGILQQARGERVEVTLANNAAQPGNLAGAIIGVEKKKVPSKDGGLEAEFLNLWCAEGVRSVPLSDVSRLRFSSPTLENEFRRALETLALSHDSQKKAVSLQFSGEGKRKVEVSYVTENPIWKTTYRLALGQDGKPRLQGWAVVENATDEDWDGVGVALVSGRPISFKMDLYNPLYVPRPTVEPELFASLRPPTYSGGFDKFDDDGTGVGRRSGGPAGQSSPTGPGNDSGSVNNKRLREYAEKWGTMPAWERAEALAELTKDAPPKYRQFVEDYFKQLSKTGTAPPYEVRAFTPRADSDAAKELADRLKRQMDLGGHQSVATAGQLGDFFQYVVQMPVKLNRQKSALLPIIDSPVEGKRVSIYNPGVEGKRVSIYNPGVQAKHPLLGLKFKNTSGANLAQGPVTVYDGGSYAGDTRWLDLQPGEERLVSYAIDLGTEVATKDTGGSQTIKKVKAVRGVVYTTTLVREEKTYDVANRSAQDRLVLIEHPNRKGQGFTFVGAAKEALDKKTAEEAADVYRFEVPVAAKKTVTYTVTEERTRETSVSLSDSPDAAMRLFLSMKETPEGLKQKLAEAVKLKGALDKTRNEIANAGRRVEHLNTEQKRHQESLKVLPKDAPTYKKTIDRLEENEKELEALTARHKDLVEREAKERTAYETFLENLSAE